MSGREQDPEEFHGPGGLSDDMGVGDTSRVPTPEDAPPDQSPDGEEVRPDEPTPPQSGYPSADPRSAESPYEPG